MSLQEQLKTAEACIKYHHSEEMAAMDMADNIKAEIAEAVKPKLKTGDIYRIDDGFSMHLADFHDPQNSIIVTNSCRAHLDHLKRIPDGPIVANLKDYFDDLKALQEEVTEFKLISPTEPHRTLHICLTRHANHIAEINLRVNGTHKDCFFLSAETLSELARNLRQMVATAKRNK